MPSHGTVLWWESDNGRKRGVGLLDDRLDLAVEQLLDVIAHSAEGVNDPTQGLWYCEKVQR